MRSQEPPRVLIYTQEFPPFNAGAGYYCAQVAAALQSVGVFVHVLAPSYPGLRPETALIDEKCVSRFTGISAIRSGWRLLWLVLRHRITHIVFGDAGAIADLLVMPRPNFIAYSVITHGTEILRFLHPQRTELDETQRDRLRRFVGGAQAIIHSSNATMRLLEESEVSREGCMLVYPAVEPSMLPPSPPERLQRLKERYRIADEPVVLSIARLAAEKGQDVLLKAFAKVLIAHPNAILIIGGEGPMRSTLESLANDLSITDSVRFSGRISADELSAHHQLSSFFVMASRSTHRFEGFGIVYVEAALFERPSVAGNQGGVPEAVENDVTGLLVDPTNTDAVASAINLLLDDSSYRNRLGKAALERAQTRFCLQNMAESLVNRNELAITPFPGHTWKVPRLAAWTSRLLLKSIQRLPQALRNRLNRRR